MDTPSLEPPDGLNQQAPHPSPTSARTVLDYPEVAQATADVIRRLPDLIDRKMAGERSAEGALSIRILAWTALVVLIVVGAATYLTMNGKLSSDAFTFLIGAVVGAAFTFMRNFFPGA